MTKSQTPAKLDRLFSLLRSHRDDMTIQQAQAFAIIAEADENNTPLNGSDVVKKLGVPRGRGYRIVWILGTSEKMDPVAKRQMNLVTEGADPLSRQSKLLILTPKGRQLWRSILDSL